MAMTSASRRSDQAGPRRAPYRGAPADLADRFKTVSRVIGSPEKGGEPRFRRHQRHQKAMRPFHAATLAAGWRADNPDYRRLARPTLIGAGANNGLPAAEPPRFRSPGRSAPNRQSSSRRSSTAASVSFDRVHWPPLCRPVAVAARRPPAADGLGAIHRRPPLPRMLFTPFRCAAR
jgi:hypothetical protein